MAYQLGQGLLKCSGKYILLIYLFITKTSSHSLAGGYLKVIFPLGGFTSAARTDNKVLCFSPLALPPVKKILIMIIRITTTTTTTAIISYGPRELVFQFQDD